MGLIHRLGAFGVHSSSSSGAFKVHFRAFWGVLRGSGPMVPRASKGPKRVILGQKIDFSEIDLGGGFEGRGGQKNAFLGRFEAFLRPFWPVLRGKNGSKGLL